MRLTKKLRGGVAAGPAPADRLSATETLAAFDEFGNLAATLATDFFEMFVAVLAGDGFTALAASFLDSHVSLR